MPLIWLTIVISSILLFVISVDLAFDLSRCGDQKTDENKDLIYKSSLTFGVLCILLPFSQIFATYYVGLGVEDEIIAQYVASWVLWSVVVTLYAYETLAIKYCINSRIKTQKCCQ